MTDPRFEVNDPLRPDVADALANLPLVAIAWRAMRSEYERRRQEEKSVGEALIDVADEMERLRKAAAAALGGDADNPARPLAGTLANIADNLERILSRLGVEVAAPAGEPYTPERMEIMDNIAQVTMPGIDGPLIHEVVQSAVSIRGGLQRMGKAVIAWPENIEHAG